MMSSMIIQNLLFIEEEAQACMLDLEKEQEYLAKKSEKELADYIEKLSREADAEILRLTQESESAVAAAIEKIQMDYAQKESELVAAFKENGDAWVDEILRDVTQI